MACASATHKAQHPTAPEGAALPSAPARAAEMGGAVRCSPSHAGQALSFIPTWTQQPAKGEVSFGLVYSGHKPGEGSRDAHCQPAAVKSGLQGTLLYRVWAPEGNLS